jgi:hypothetical protein
MDDLFPSSESGRKGLPGLWPLLAKAWRSKGGRGAISSFRGMGHGEESRGDPESAPLPERLKGAPFLENLGNACFTREGMPFLLDANAAWRYSDGRAQEGLGAEELAGAGLSPTFWGLKASP